MKISKKEAISQLTGFLAPVYPKIISMYIKAEAAGMVLIKCPSKWSKELKA